MATNHIYIEFDPCEPVPAGGYRVRYRILGSGGVYRTAGPFMTSPAHIVDNLDPAGTSYEGFIQGDCGGGKLGVSVPWVAEFSGSAVAPSSEAPSSAPSSEPPAEGCRSYVLTATVGTPSAHYIDCGGVERDTLITDHTTICTDGNGFTISGGGVTVNSFTDGVCGTLSNPFRYGETGGAVCAATPVSLWWFGPLAALTPGTIMYTDAGMTTPLLGQSFISDSLGSEIFNMNPATGAVGTSTGTSC